MAAAKVVAGELAPLGARTLLVPHLVSLALPPVSDASIKEKLDLLVERSMLPFSELGQFCFELCWNAQQYAGS
jgi:hypothetical protein